MALTKIDDRGLKTPIDLQDNEKIRLGTGNDLQIFHDGTNSKVVNSTGSLMTLSDEVRWKNNANNETLFVANANAGVRLFYDNTQRFATTSSGVTVTGTVAATSYTGDGSSLTGVASAVADGCIYENSQTISNNYTISTNKNALSAGPITIANGVTLTIPSGSTYVIV